ncbi:MAG: hypothetical protein SOZ24_01900 [Treponema sp.]|nr:hypothetical protein [Treponema sp.]
MRKNTFNIPQEEMDRFHKAMDAERTEQDARLEKLIESEKANIPSNEEIIKMIPSKAVSEYLQKIGHQFSERDRYLLWLYLDPKKEDESEELWEKGRYVSVPHPFRRGDIVVCYASCLAFTNSGEHKGKYEIGIMQSFADADAWTEWDNVVKTRLKSVTDFSDVSTTVEFLYPDGSFSHEHPNPMELEFARDVKGALPEDSPKTDYLEVASDLMKGDGSIELFQMYRDDYLESAQHLNELLESIRHELHEYVWENFNSYRKLYIPDDSLPIQKLTKEQKDEADNYVWRMEHNVKTIEDNMKDLAIPTATLKTAFKKGLPHKRDEEIESEKTYLKETGSIISDIYEDYKLAQTQVKLFTEMQNAPRKQFYQVRLLKAIGKAEKMLNGLIEITGVKGQTLSDEDVLSTGNQIIDKHIEAFKNLSGGKK